MPAQVIERHYEVVGRILVYLIEGGLKRRKLDDSTALKIIPEQVGDQKTRVISFQDCMRWMEDEGLIRIGQLCKTTTNCTFFDVQVTSIGIAVIQEPTADADIAPNIETVIAETHGTGLDTGTFTKIGGFVGGLLGGAIKVLGS